MEVCGALAVVFAAPNSARARIGVGVHEATDARPLRGPPSSVSTAFSRSLDRPGETTLAAVVECARRLERQRDRTRAGGRRDDHFV